MPATSWYPMASYQQAVRSRDQGRETRRRRQLLTVPVPAPHEVRFVIKLERCCLSGRLGRGRRPAFSAAPRTRGRYAQAMADDSLVPLPPTQLQERWKVRSKAISRRSSAAPGNLTRPTTAKWQPLMSDVDTLTPSCDLDGPFSCSRSAKPPLQSPQRHDGARARTSLSSPSSDKYPAVSEVLPGGARIRRSLSPTIAALVPVPTRRRTV